MRKILLLLLPVIILTSSCRWGNGKRVKGSGNIKTEERSVSAFDKVEVHGAIDVYVSQGALQPVKIEGDDNLLEYIEVKQEGEKVIVRNRKGYNLKPTRGVKIYVTSPSYADIDVSGACDIVGQTKVTSNSSLKLHVSGAGDINMDVDVPEVTAEISGSGSIKMTGKTRDFYCEMSGAAKAKCFDLLAENVKVDISGAGDADVYASIKLDAEVSGAGSVRYKGNATDVDQKVSGAGSVKKAD
jgi:hypothetical protein